MQVCHRCNEFNVVTQRKSRHKKYCDTCKVIVQKEQIKAWMRKTYNAGKVAGYCQMCNVQHPITAHRDRKYCTPCLRKVIKQKKREAYFIKQTLNNTNII